MSNRLDKLFHDKLASGNFTPSDSEWANMEELIENDLGSGSGFEGNGSGISINILFTGFFVFLLLGGVSKGQLIREDKAIKNTTTASSIEATIAKSENEKKISFSKAEQSTLSTEEKVGFNDPANTKYTNSSTDQLISNGGKNPSLNEKTIEGSISIADGNTNLNEQYLDPANSSSLNNGNEKIEYKYNSQSEASQSSYSVTKTNVKSNTLSENSTIKTVSFVNAQTSGKSGSLIDPRLNDVSNSPSIDSQKPQLNSTYDYKRHTQEPQTNVDYSSSLNDYSKSNSSFLNKNTFLLLSNPIMSFEDFKSIDQIVSLEKEPDLFKVTKQKTKREFPLQLSLAAFGEVAWVSKKLTGANEYSSLINTRNEQEKGLLKFNAGIELQAKYKGFGINTGFSIVNYGENVQYEEKYITEWEVSNNVLSDTLWTQEIEWIYDTVYNPIDSTWIWMIVDSSFVTVIDSVIYINQLDSTEVFSPLGLTKQNGKTKISYWEIPLYFSYQFDLDNFYLSPGLGVTFGFWKMTNGHYMAKDEQSLIPINTEYYVLKKTIINANIMLGVGYKLNDQFSLEVTPSFKFNVNNIFIDDQIIQKYKSLSLQFRLRYYF